MAKIKSPLRYPGGKSRAVAQIVSLIPPGTTTLASPFFGGGSVEIACATMGMAVHGYDTFEPLVNFWQMLLLDARDLSATVRREHYPLTRAEFYELQKKQYTDHRMESAAAFYALNRSSYSGTTFSGGMSIGHPRFNKNALQYLREFHIEGVEIRRQCFTQSIPNHSGDFLYCDPPYLLPQKLYGNFGSLHTGFDHHTLAELLKGREGWLLSYNDCEEIRELYKGYEFICPEWAYGIGPDKKSKEILISA